VSSLEDLVKANLPEVPDLSFDRHDLESRIAFPSGPFTQPGPLLAPLLAFAATAAVYGGLALIPKSHLAVMFTERGFIPHFIVYFAAWSLALLFIKHFKVSLQRKALKLELFPTDDPGFILTPSSAEQILERLFRSVADPQRFFLTRRILLALSNLRNMRRIGDVSEVLRDQADNDEAHVDSSYALLKGLIWTLPVLGFIGTVLGLSGALGSFGEVLTSASEITELREALQKVTGGLATAFETTLQGLVATVLVHMVMIMARSREDRLLDDARDYCQKYLVGRLRLSDEDTAAG
jgi:biopolymer transport protein ExbB/TolQ